MRGTVTDLHYKGLSTQFVYGRTREMISGFTSFSGDSSIYNKGTFSRKIIGLSTQFNYHDIVELGVNYLQVEDDTTTLDDEVYGNFLAPTFGISNSSFFLFHKTSFFSGLTPIFFSPFFDGFQGPRARLATAT